MTSVIQKYVLGKVEVDVKISSAKTVTVDAVVILLLDYHKQYFLICLN
jgi:hypothetical protein